MNAATGRPCRHAFASDVEERCNRIAGIVALVGSHLAHGEHEVPLASSCAFCAGLSLRLPRHRASRKLTADLTAVSATRSWPASPASPPDPRRCRPGNQQRRFGPSPRISCIAGLQFLWRAATALAISASTGTSVRRIGGHSTPHADPARRGQVPEFKAIRRPAESMASVLGRPARSLLDRFPAVAAADVPEQPIRSDDPAPLCDQQAGAAAMAGASACPFLFFGSRFGVLFACRTMACHRAAQR